jgi:hypothetical protein
LPFGNDKGPVVLLLAISAGFLLITPVLSAPVSASTVVGATAYGQSYFYGSTYGNRLSGTILMNLDSDQQVCPLNASLHSPTFRVDVPLTLSSSYLGPVYAPWNSSGSDADGRHFYKWDLDRTTLTGCNDLVATGSANMNPQFNLSRKISPSVLTAPWALVKVTTSMTSIATYPQFCMGASDQPTANTTSTLVSFSFKETPLNPAAHEPGTPTASSGDDSFDICFASGASGGMKISTTSVWNVTRLVAGGVVWKPLVTAVGILTACIGCSPQPGMTVKVTSTYVVLDSDFMTQFHETMRMGSSAGGVRFSWSSVGVNQIISLQLFPLSDEL